MKGLHYITLLIISIITTSCYKSDIEELGNRIDAIEKTQIKSQQDQIDAIKSTITELEQTDKNLKDYIKNLQTTDDNLQKAISETDEKIKNLESSFDGKISTAKTEIIAQLTSIKSETEIELAKISTTIVNLQAKDATLESRISELSTFVYSELSKMEDWAEATFATLKQYNEVSDEIAVIKSNITTLNSSIESLEKRMTETIASEIEKALEPIKDELVQSVISDVADSYMQAINTAKSELTAAYTQAIVSAISNIETSIKGWVSEQLEGYYTIAETDALLATMKLDYDQKLTKQKEYLEDLLSSLSSELKEMISDNSTLIEDLRNKTTDLENTISVEQTNMIAQNATAIAENTQRIMDNIDDINANKLVIEANSKLISENNLAIKQLESSVDESVADIAAEISANAENIAKNAELIVKNSIAISNNAQAIADNVADILQLRQDLASAKEEITAAYTAAIEEAISNSGLIDEKIAASIAEVNSNIDNKISQINETIITFGNRLDKVEGDIEDLLTRIQSISYIPTYSDGKATLLYCGDIRQITLDFEISPKDAIADLKDVWQSALSLKAIYTQTRAVSFIELPIIRFESDAANGTITVTASCSNLSADVLNGSQDVSVRLSISDGNSSVISGYVPIISKQVNFEDLVIPENEIWYTNGSVYTSTKPYKTYNVFGASLLSNTYDYTTKCWVMTFDGNVTSIGDYAFYNCSDILSMKLPDSVTSIGEHAFNGCTALSSIKLGNEVMTIGNHAFSACQNLSSIDIPDYITTIGNYAFYNCANLTEATIGNSVETIGDYAFAFTGLTNIDIPGNVVTIGDSAFCECDNLTEVNIANGVKTIMLYAFSVCNNLSTITIPESVKTIGTGVFNSCFNLTSLYCRSVTPPALGPYMYFSAAIRIYVPAESINEYRTADRWSEYAGAITVYDFVNDVVVTESHANNEIWYTSSTGEVVVPNLSDAFDVTITSNTYANGKGIIRFNGTITSIGNQAFSGCTGLTSVTLPDSITSIGSSSFYNCSGLTYVKTGTGVTAINSHAFNGCTSLVTVYCEAVNVPTLGYYAFDNNASNRKICVPESSLSSYKNNSGWYSYSTYLIGYDY